MAASASKLAPAPVCAAIAVIYFVLGGRGVMYATRQHREDAEIERHFKSLRRDTLVRLQDGSHWLDGVPNNYISITEILSFGLVRVLF